MRTLIRSHRQLTAFGSFPEPYRTIGRRWLRVHRLMWYNVFELEISDFELGAHCLWLTSSQEVASIHMQSTTTNSFGVGDSIVPPGSQKNAATRCSDTVG